MRGIKIPQQDFVLKTQGGGGGLCTRGGGAYLRDTTVITFSLLKNLYFRSLCLTNSGT